VEFIWHGFYELSRNFYTHFLPLAQELGDKARKGKQVREFIRKTLQGPDGQNWPKYHQWTEGLTGEQMKVLLEYEQQTYGARK